MADKYHLVLPSDFTVQEAVTHLFVLVAFKDDLAPHEDLTVHFVDRWSRRHESWRDVPHSGDLVADDVLNEIDLGPDAYAKIAPDLGPEFEALARKIAEESDPDRRPRSKRSATTPEVNRRLPEFLAGAQLVADGDLVTLHALLEDVTRLLTIASGELKRDPSADVLDMDTLLGLAAAKMSTRRASAEEFTRLDRIARRAFVRLHEEQLSREQIERDFASVRIEELDLLTVGVCPGGALAVAGKPKAKVLWAESNEPRFASVARKRADADLVVQFSKRGCRALVILSERLSPVSNGRRTGGLAHVAAMLRNADAAVRKGARPEANRLVCSPGLIAPPGEGQLPVFRMSVSGNVVGNLDQDLPRSALTTAQIEERIRSVMASGLLTGSPDVFDRVNGLATADQLARACMPGNE